MSVIQLSSEPAAPVQSLAARRLRRGGTALAVLFAIFFALTAAVAAVLVAAVLFWSGPGLSIGPTSVHLNFEGGPPPAGYTPFHELAPMHRFAYAVVGVLRVAPALFVLYGLASLFGLYARGLVFEKANINRLKWVGAGLIGHALAPLAGHLILAAGGWEIDRRWLHFASLQALLLGVIVLVIAQVMELGREIEDERSHFV